MDDIFVLFRISCLIGHIPAQGFKEGINELSSELGFVVSRASVGFDVSLEAFNKIGYLFQRFFHGNFPLAFPLLSIFVTL